jgi:hypothetical protein
MVGHKSLRQLVGLVGSVIVLLGVCAASYRHPVLEGFDRLIYEAIVLGKSKPIDVVYETVKQENERAEASSILDSPQHLLELEPLYAIRPLYVGAIWSLSFIMPLRQAIDFLSAASYFGIGIIAIIWTRRPLLAALLVSAYPLLVLARVGVPDSLSALFVITGLWLVGQQRFQLAGLLLLFVSVGVRTDNILLLLAVVGWCAWKKRVGRVAGAGFALASVAFVCAINYRAGNYGWIALFQYSFLGHGRLSPAAMPHTLTVSQYFGALVRGTLAIAVHVTLWILLGILAWFRRPSSVLIVTSLAVTAHFLMFPSPEDRYFVWAYIVVGIALIRSFGLASDAGSGSNFHPGRIGW